MILVQKRLCREEPVLRLLPMSYTYRIMPPASRALSFFFCLPTACAVGYSMVASFAGLVQPSSEQNHRHPLVQRSSSFGSPAKAGSPQDDKDLAECSLDDKGGAGCSPQDDKGRAGYSPAGLGTRSG